MPKFLRAALCAAGLLAAASAGAQSQTPPTPQFFITGYIQEATLDTSGAICTPGNDPQTGRPSDRLRGGTMTVNGTRMIVPCNTLLQLPAATMTWGDLFAPGNSLPVGAYLGAPAVPVPANPIEANVKTGLALADAPTPFPAFTVSVSGNVVKNPVSGIDEYLIGLIAPIDQEPLNGSSGLVSFIDYASGAFRVGGIPNDPACAAGGITSPGCSGALVQINDPVGRWGKPHSPDPRFSGDYENSTVSASTGFPVCIPRVAPPAIDPECPLSNRPLNGDPRFAIDPFLATGAPLKKFTMPAPVLKLGANGLPLDPPVNTVTPDAYKQVPIMVGDQLNLTGTIYKLDPTKTIIQPDGSEVPDNTAANTYLSAHTVDDVLGIFTAPGVAPAYVTVEDLLIGTGGAAVQGILQEASTRLTLVGFTTDPTRLIDLYAQDVNPCTGQESLRLLATTDPATQPLVGRFVHRVLGGDFMPPTRNYVVKTRTQKLDANGNPVELVAANGLVTGQFLLPNFEYVFAENHSLGAPIIPNNYQDLPFLAQGSGPVDGFGSGTPILGQLDPFPTAPEFKPAKVNCAAFGAFPVTSVGPNVVVSVGAQVTLSGAVTWDANDAPASRLVQWSLNGAPVSTSVTSSDATHSTASTSFTAPSVPGSQTYTLTASDNFGSASASLTVTVVAGTDTVQIPTATWITQNGKRGPFGKLSVTATTSDPKAVLSLSQRSVDGTVSNWGTGSSSPSNPTTFSWVEIKGAAQPVSLTVSSTKGGSATVTCSAPDLRGAVTCP